jgi:predicted RNA-binding protein (virulence factor B family)
MKATHKTRLIDYLKEFGSITSLEAIRDLGNTRLSATIYTLKKEGFNILSEDTSVPTRFKNKNGHTKYTQVSKYILIDS